MFADQDEEESHGIAGRSVEDALEGEVIVGGEKMATAIDAQRKVSEKSSSSHGVFRIWAKGWRAEGASDREDGETRS